jgi:hypothetical protein
MIVKYTASTCLLLPLLCFVLSGCHRAGATEDDHLEHHVPAHKPSHLATAIDEIERRYAAVAKEDGIQSPERITQLKELVDIVRWLPEIAGDSDLPEEQWNVVDGVSEYLWPLLQDQLNQAERGERISIASLTDSVTTAVKQLRDAADKPPAVAIVGGRNREESSND